MFNLVLISVHARISSDATTRASTSKQYEEDNYDDVESGLVLRQIR